MWLKFDPAHDALFLDVDGTLLDIASSAQGVVVPEKLVGDLRSLSRKLNGALAVISGRRIREIDKLLEPLRIPCAGAHGAEWRGSPEGPIKKSQPLPLCFRESIADAFRRSDRIVVEDKSYCIAVHYRGISAKSDYIEHKIKRLMKEGPEGLTLMGGRKVFEVARLAQNKGAAVERFMSVYPFKGRRPVFLGDDITDISAIGACMKFGGKAARVGRGKPNRKNAFYSPAKVRQWIARYAK